MSRTETKVVQETVPSPELDLAKLKTVTWIGSCEIVVVGYKFTSVKYKAAKELIPFLSWYLAFIEMIAFGAYMFVNSLPYPNFFLDIIFKIDYFGEKMLDSMANKLEWKPSEISNPTMNDGATSPSRAQEIPLIEFDNEGANRLLSGTSSECESEVSIVSELWNLGYTDKFGKTYNRLEMKATAEGRLRTAMYKRVKGQLSLMRQNSVSFQKGMTEYVRQILQPKILPVYNAFKLLFDEIVQKYGLLEIFNAVSKLMEKHYIFFLPVSITISMAMIPLNILTKILIPKKKSKKTRSMRSESLRRRAEATGSIGFKQSKEPDSPEEPDYYALANIRKSYMKGENDANIDSALTSSIDDLCHTSDSNDGSGSLKGQVIIEEDGKKEQGEINQWIKNQEIGKVLNGNALDKKKANGAQNINSKDTKNNKIANSSTSSSSSSSSDSSTDSEDSLNNLSNMRPGSSQSNNTDSKSIESNSSLTSTVVKREKNENDRNERRAKQQRRISFSLT